MLLKLAREFGRGRVVRGKDNKSFNDLAAHLVRAGDHCGLGDGGMFFQRALDLEGADAIPGTYDHIIRPADEPEIAILILIGAITRDIPVAAYTVVGGFGIAPI